MFHEISYSSASHVKALVTYHDGSRYRSRTDADSAFLELSIKATPPADIFAESTAHAEIFAEATTPAEIFIEAIALAEILVIIQHLAHELLSSDSRYLQIQHDFNQLLTSRLAAIVQP